MTAFRSCGTAGLRAVLEQANAATADQPVTCPPPAAADRLDVLAAGADGLDPDCFHAVADAIVAGCVEDGQVPRASFEGTSGAAAEAMGQAVVGAEGQLADSWAAAGLAASAIRCAGDGAWEVADDCDARMAAMMTEASGIVGALAPAAAAGDETAGCQVAELTTVLAACLEQLCLERDRCLGDIMDTATGECDVAADAPSMPAAPGPAAAGCPPPEPAQPAAAAGLDVRGLVAAGVSLGTQVLTAAEQVVRASAQAVGSIESSGLLDMSMPECPEPQPEPCPAPAPQPEPEPVPVPAPEPAPRPEPEPVEPPVPAGKIEHMPWLTNDGAAPERAPEPEPEPEPVAPAPEPAAKATDPQPAESAPAQATESDVTAKGGANVPKAGGW